MEQPVPSEEKLLKLIRKKEKPGSIGRGTGNPEFSASHKARSAGSANRIQYINRIFFVLIFVFLGFISLKVLRYAPIEEEMSLKMDTGEPLLQQNFDFSGARPFAEYVQSLEKRNIFDFEVPQMEPVMNLVNMEIIEPDPVVEEPVPDVASTLKLVGIVLSNVPEAIVENQQNNNETVFLRKGDQINGAVVEEIKEGILTLNVRGQKVELAVP